MAECNHAWKLIILEPYRKGTYSAQDLYTIAIARCRKCGKETGMETLPPGTPIMAPTDKKTAKVFEDCCDQESPGNAAPERQIANADQEAILLHRLATLVRMAQNLERARSVAADTPAYNTGMRGILHGTACEILFTLDMEPCFENLDHVAEDPVNAYDPRGPLGGSEIFHPFAKRVSP